MNQNRSPLLSLWLALALAILPALRAQEAPPATPAAPEKPATEQVPPAAPEEKMAAQDADKAAAPATDAAAVEPSEADAPMRDLAPAADADAKPKAKSSKRTRRERSLTYDKSVDGPPFGSHQVPAGQTWREAVSVFGDTQVDGTVADAAVSVFGNTTVNGTVRGEAVSVLGTTTINGKVDGVAVAVLGDLVLGPNAEVGDQVVVVLGKLTRSPGAITHGGVQEIGGFGPFQEFEWLRVWIVKCVLWGRPLAFGENLGWAWGVAGIFLVFYMLLALLFPRGIERCAEALEQKPGNTILAALLATLLTPILIVLLAITGIGIILIPFIVAGIFFGTLFGKAAVFAWFGRRVTHLFGDGALKHAVFAVMFGGIMVSLLYVIPFLGFLLWKLFGILGLGMVVYVLISSMKREKPAVPAPVAPAPPGTAAAAAMPLGATSAGFGAATPVAEPPPAFSAAPAPIISAATTLPRAGFWIRFAAAFLDFIMIAIALAIIDAMDRGPGPLFLVLAAYSAAMWKFKGTTIGGVVCGLRVVRLDDRPIDWGVAIVRALSAFLSFFMLGLGFIWVAFDNERQSWHDKIAGTTIVKVPKGTPLI
ncbi:MAG: hypothetical protein C0518_10670 [Opitutus sp.]|nr:hypothetical protein [Opitutus sp.]